MNFAKPKMPTEREIDKAVDAYIQLMEAGDPLWREAEAHAAHLIELRHLEEEL